MKTWHKNNCQDITGCTQAIAEIMEIVMYLLSPAKKACQNYTASKMDPYSNYIHQDDRNPQLWLTRTNLQPVWRLIISISFAHLCEVWTCMADNVIPIHIYILVLKQRRKNVTENKVEKCEEHSIQKFCLSFSLQPYKLSNLISFLQTEISRLLGFYRYFDIPSGDFVIMYNKMSQIWQRGGGEYWEARYEIKSRKGAFSWPPTNFWHHQAIFSEVMHQCLQTSHIVLSQHMPFMLCNEKWRSHTCDYQNILPVLVQCGEKLELNLPGFLP